MGKPVVPTDLEAAPSLQEGEPAAVEPSAEVAQTLDDTLNHVESIGRPHDWWWAINKWRKQRALSVFGHTVCARFDGALTSKYWLLFTVAITLFCLYAVDVCDSAAGSVEARTVVSGVLLGIFIIFLLDLVLSSVFVDKYLLSFFFWVDLIGTASLILDIQWFADGILKEEDSNALQITRAGRAARIGSQMGRITRVLRLLRALRLLKVLQLRKRAKQGMDPHGAGSGPMRPTVLGELLAESTTRKCVVIILFVLVVATFLQPAPASAADYSRIQLVSYGIMTPQAFVQNAPHPVILMSYVDALDGSLVEYVPYTRSNMRGLMQLRTSVQCAKFVGSVVEGCGFANEYSIVWYDVTKTAQLNAGLNLILTTVIIVCLGLSAYFFGRDATTYVIMPIETMLKYLKRMIMVGMDGDVESEHINFRKPPETDLLANYVSRLVNEIDTARWKAEEEARISDTLLNSMVPPRIARLLKELRWWEAGPEQRAQTIADSFPHATVLFTDIVGFTVLSSRISAEDAMRHLNNMYTIFDEIVEKYGLYKVETIGDSYMLVGGAPEERLDHAERVAAAALEIRGCVPLLQEISGEPGINVRIGMHSGAVTAGVVGFKNPRWHLFGDTCNTASRMESTGIAGEIQLSCTTYELIKERFQCKVRGKIAVKGKGEMVTYLLEREYGGVGNPPDSPSGLVAAGGGLALGPAGGGGGLGGGGDAMDREAFLSSPQFKKAMERYTTARSSFLTEEEELCKLLKSLDEATATAAVAAVGGGAAAGGGAGQPLPQPQASPPPDESGAATAAAGTGAVASAAEAVAAAGVVVPRLAVGLGPGAFKQLVLAGSTPSDLKALALHMHEELGLARAMMAAAEEEKAAGIRRDMLLKLYARVLDAPGMSLRNTFAAILDTLYKVIECDVIKLYVVDHARGQLWPVTRHSATDANRTLPLEGTLAGSAVRRARVVRVDDVATAQEFNLELEELPAGYTSKSMMCVPVFSVTSYQAHPGVGVGVGHPARTTAHGAASAGLAHHHHTSQGSATRGSAAACAGAAGAPGPGDVIAVLVMVNRWTPWREAGAEEGERRIVPFEPSDEACVRDAASSVGLLLMRRRGEMLLASAVPPSGLAGASFSVAALPASVARRRLRTVVRRSSVALLDTRGNLWGMKQEELMGQARDVLSALQRRVEHGALTVLGAAGEEALVSYLVRIADEQGAGRFFNLAHSVGVLQGIYLTLRMHTELAAALGSQHLLALVLAATLLNVDRDGELLPAVPTGAGALAIGATGVTSGGASGRTSRARAHVGGGSAGVATAAATGFLGLSPAASRARLQPLTSTPLPPPPPSQQVLQQPPQQQPPLPPSAGSLLRHRASLSLAGSFRNSEPGLVAMDAATPEQRVSALAAGPEAAPQPPPGSPFTAPAAGAAAATRLPPSAASSKRWRIGRFASGPPSPLSSPRRSPLSSPSSAAKAKAELMAREAQAMGLVPVGEDTVELEVETEEAATPLDAATNGDGVGVAGGTPPPAASASPRSPNSLPGLSMSVPLPSAAMLAGVPQAVTVPATSPQGGGAAGATSGGVGSASAGYFTSRNRAVSARRGRLAAVVDDILSGDTNILSALPHAEAAAVKTSIATLLALRNQPTTVLSMPGLQPHRSGDGGGDANAVAADSGGVFGSAAGVAAATAALATAAEGPASGGVGDGTVPGCGRDAQAPSPLPTPRSVHWDGRSSSTRENGPVAADADATAAAAAAPAPAPAGASPGRRVGGVGGGPSPLSLAALIQAAESDPNRLAETRTAVCALLLLTWSELLHCKDPGTALSLLQSRAADVRNWASRLAANVSSRWRTVSLLGSWDNTAEDVPSLLLLEVPRMQLEVIPLWQRTAELLPGLQPQLDALQANRATYISMLQDTASLTATSSYGGIAAPAAGGSSAAAGGATSAWGGGGGDRASAQQCGSGGSAAGGGGPASAFWRPSLLRSGAALDGAPSGREPRRFISVKQRGSSALARTVLSVMPSGDSVDSHAGGGGGAGTRTFIRASSSRSYGGRNGPEDYDADLAEPAGDHTAAAAAATGGRASSGAKLLRQSGFPMAGARSLRRVGSGRATGGGPPPVASSRLASLALQASGNVGFVGSASAAAAVNGLGLGRASDGSALGVVGCGGSGHRTSGSNQSYVAHASDAVSEFRPRSQTYDHGTPPSAMSAAAAAVAAPISPPDDGQRRGSITTRFNELFSSFRGSGRLANRSHHHAAAAAAAVDDGPSAHFTANAVPTSPVTGAPSSPRPSLLFLGASPFEMYGCGYGTHDGALVSQNSQQLSANLALAATAAAAPISSTGAPQLNGNGGGGGAWGDVQPAPAPAAAVQIQMLQMPQSPAALSPVASLRAPTAPSATAVAGGDGAVTATAAAGPAAPHVSPDDRGSSPTFKVKLHASFMRRLSHVAAKLPFHAGAGATAASGASWSGVPQPAPPPAASAAPPPPPPPPPLQLRAEVSLRVSDGGGLLATATDQAPSPSLLRAGTLQAQQYPAEQHQVLRQARLSHPLEAPARTGSPPPRRRVTAPSGALALAQQHEQTAASVAAAAIAFAARQAADAASGDGTSADGIGRDDIGCDGSGTGVAVEPGPGLGLVSGGSMVSLIGSGLTAGGALPTVAEFSGSGRNSSATGTARTNSTAPGETIKHAAAHAHAHPFFPRPRGSSGGGGADAAVGGDAATPTNPSRHEQTPAASPRYRMLEVSPAPSSPPPSSCVPVSPASLATTPSPVRAPTFADVSVTVPPSTSGASISVAASTAVAADSVAEGRAAPHHHASSKGVWLGLRLATDALRSVGRRPDGGGYSTSSSGVLALDPALGAPELETPKLSGAPTGAAGELLFGVHVAAAPPPSPAATATVAHAGSASASGSRNPSRMQTPSGSLRRGGAVPVGVGGVASLQAVIDMAEAALAGSSSVVAASLTAPYSPSRAEYRSSSGGIPTPAGGANRNQSHRRGPAASPGQAMASGTGSGATAAAAAAPASNQLSGPLAPACAALDDAFNQRTSAPPAPSRFSLRQTAASCTFTDQATAISATPSLRPGQLPEQV